MPLGHLQNMHQLKVLHMEDSDGICAIGLLIGVWVGLEGVGLGKALVMAMVKAGVLVQQGCCLQARHA